MPLRLAANWAHHHHFLRTALVRAGREQAFWRAGPPCLHALPDTDLTHLPGLVEGGPVLRAACDILLWIHGTKMIFPAGGMEIAPAIEHEGFHRGGHRNLPWNEA